MADILKRAEDQLGIIDASVREGDRRSFLKWAGATAAFFTVAGSLTGCSDDETTNPTTGSVTLTNDDTGVLNYAYALEQLEAAFYTQVCTSFYSGATADEKAILTDIRDHEIAHREFFKAALGANAISALEVNFSTIDFSSRTSVLNTAKAFEDLGVSAYNGAGKLITNSAYLVIAGQIVSVEARHASIIRDLLMPKNAAMGFAGDDISGGDPTNGLDGAKAPSAVLATASAYVKTTIVNNLG